MIQMSPWRQVMIALICIVATIFALPNFLPQSARDALADFLPPNTMNLGLDLSGGSYLLLEVETEVAVKDRLESMRGDLRKRMREEGIGFSSFQVGTDTISFRLIDLAQLDAARTAIGDLIGGNFGSAAEFTLQISDSGDAVLTLTEAARAAIASGAVDQSIEIVRRRIDELGTREPTIQRQGANRILVQVPGLSDPERLKALLGKTAKLEFRFIDESMDVTAALQLGPPPGSEVLPSEEMGPDGQPFQFLVQKEVIVAGDRLTGAQQGFDERNRPAVLFSFDTVGARRFGDATRENVNRLFAIVLDGVVITAPRINEPILTGSGQITGSFTVESANDLAILLRAGALPAPITIEESRTVGAELGADSIVAGTNAAIAGFALVVVLMLLVYGLFGIFANIALILNLIIIVGIMTALQSTLTLPGIAGIVLTMGMAVDANVLIFERMREEVAQGRSVISAVDAGYNRAMSAIIDANLTTLLAVLILFQLGSGPVRGFAVTLGIGITVSMFTAIMVTRLFVIYWLWGRKPKALPI
ncbi:MAG TPA: protein translocase subunit SecD [Micropepsaceae bacterium]|nr:protein translocase subunit SecD [Micropepsaceae bacterium]